MATGEVLLEFFIASKLDIFAPFLSKKVTGKLRALEKTEICDDILQLEQPNTITSVTLRDYQLKGVSITCVSYDSLIPYFSIF